MPKKDGTPTKYEIRQAENYERISRLTDQADKIERRFRAQGFAVTAFVGTLNLEPEVAEAILDRLEDR